MIRDTLQSLCTALDPKQFVRVNRSVVANLEHVDRIERDADSHLVFVMRDGRTCNVGRVYHPQVTKALGLQKAAGSS